MAELSDVDLLRRIEELEAENGALRERGAGRSATSMDAGAAAAAPRRHRRGWGWTVLATVLILLGSLLAPVALVASWSRTALTDTDRFVATYAPLAQDPRIQAYVAGQAMEVIGEQIDIATITSDLIDGITALGTGPRATEALELLKGPAAAGVQSLIESGVTGFVESEAFSNVWATALRVSHAQLERAVGADPAAALQLGDDGSIGIQLGPIIAAVKAALLERGIGLANQIPAVDRTIVIAQSDSLATVRLAYGVVVAAGSWLPWVAILLLALGVAVARRRAVALIWAAVALALAMLLSLAGLGIGSIALVSTLSPAVLPAGIVGLLYETVAGDVRATAIAVLVLAIVVAAVAWLAGPFDIPRRLRGLTRDAAGAIRGAAERRGVTTGGFGAWIFARRKLLRAIVAVVAAAVVLLVRPLTIGVTLWTLVLALLVLALLEVLERPTIAAPQATERRGSEQRAVDASIDHERSASS